MADDADQAPEAGEGAAKGAAEQVHVGRAPRPLTQQIGRIAAMVAAAIFVVFALVNAQYVEFSWIFGSTKIVTEGQDRIAGGVRLIFLMLAAFGLGSVVGAGLQARRVAKKQVKKAAKK